jgi:23S rRNA (guanosine2251-2'-O)-methyltransferase
MTESVYGRHPVQEVLRAGRREVNRILIAEESRSRGGLQEILREAKAKNIPIVLSTRKSLDNIISNHQGVIAEVGDYPYVDLTQIATFQDPENALVLLLDVIQDPQNLGTLLRTAEAVGVDGILLPHRGSAGVSPAVVSASAGASEHLHIARENLAQSIQLLQESGLWVMGLENSDDAKTLDEVDFKVPLAVVVGGESDGIRRLVRESCDFLVRLPMQGQISSLNAAVAGSIVLYSIWSGRGFQTTGASEMRNMHSGSEGS